SSCDILLLRHPAIIALSSLPLHDALPISAQGRRLAEQLIQKLPSCPIPEIARLGKTLRRWKTPPPTRTSQPQLMRLEPSSRRRRSEEHTSELQSRFDLVCRLLLETKIEHI